MSRSDLRDVWRSGQLQSRTGTGTTRTRIPFRLARPPAGRPGVQEIRRLGPSASPTGIVNSSAAESIGGLNIIALGGEGSVSATSLTLTDDGSNTMLYASFLSDSLGGHDWQNLTTHQSVGNIRLRDPDGS